MMKPPILEGCNVLAPLDPPGRISNTPPRAERNGRNRNAGTGERFKVFNGFVDFTLARLFGSEVRVWLVLYRDTREGIARTSQADIARRAGVSPRSVGRAIVRLQRLGLVEIGQRGGLNLGPSSYRVRPLSTDPQRRTRASADVGHPCP